MPLGDIAWSGVPKLRGGIVAGKGAPACVLARDHRRWNDLREGIAKVEMLNDRRNIGSLDTALAQHAVPCTQIPREVWCAA